MNKDIGKCWKLHKIPWHKTYESHSKKSLVAKLKSLELDLGADSDLDLDKGNPIIDEEPSVTITTIKV